MRWRDLPWRELPRRAAAVLLAACGLWLAPAHGKPLRVASAFDPQTMDPHSLALLYHSRIVTQVYEGLVGRDARFGIEPALARSWSRIDPTTWRFVLRPGVRFHDGSTLTADDVVFSIERALAPSSQRRSQLRGVTGARKVDALTVDVLLEAPDAVLPEKFVFVGMMNRAWSLAHGVQLPQDLNAKQETFAVRYVADQQTVLAAHAGWWGRAAAAGGSHPTEVVYQVIQSDATRMAALASGQVDLVLDPPFQDLARLREDARLRFAEVSDIGAQYLGFDQFRDELEFADVKGRNPFKDLRVRRAVYQAIDVDLIIRKVLRGQAKATGSLVSALVDGYLPELDRRLEHDPAAARALLKEAGYPDGFGVTLDCVNVKFREAVCQSIAAMLTQVGIRTRLQSSPGATFFPKLSQAQASFVEFGWSPATDPWSTFHAILRTQDGKGGGAFNAGRYSNPALDRLIDTLRTEQDPARRKMMIGEVLRTAGSDLAIIPLYRRTLTWAMRAGVKVVQWPNDVLELRWVEVE
jgi:peptide/nickel transport system substrate-binding protein